MIGSTLLQSSLRSSVSMLISERRRLEESILELESRMATVRGAESASLREKMAQHREALAALQKEEEAERAAAAQKAAEEAAKARRARMSARERELADAHAAKLSALQDAEAHMAAAIAAINMALKCEQAERAAATALAAEMGVKTDTLNLSAAGLVSRIVGAICHSLMGITACRFRRVGALELLDDPHTRGSEPWAEREARYTTPSVELLLGHGETMRTN